MSLPARLVFTRPTSDGLPARLVFGDDSTGPGAPVTLHGAGRITGLRGYVRGRIGVSLRSSGKITGLRGHVRGHYDVNVERPLVASTTLHGQAAAAMRMLGGDSWQDASSLRLLVQHSAQQAAPVQALLETRWQDAQALRVVAGQRAQQAKPLVQIIDQSFQDASALRVWAAHRAQQAQALRAMASGRFEDANPLRRFVQQGAESATPLYVLSSQAGGQALPMHLLVMQRTQQATQPGWLKPGPIKPEKPKPCHPNLPALLCFDQPVLAGLPARLYFHCCDSETEQPPATIVVPVRRTYMVFNSITLRRVDNGAEIKAVAFSMQLNHKSWTWSWSATLPEEALPLLVRGSDGYPAELEVTVNSIPVRLRVTQKARRLPFLPRRIEVGGKGKSAVLAADYAPELNFGSQADRTAQQLANEALTINGVPIGWAIEWGIDDWFVPGDTWSLQGSYIEAIQDIATAAGAYVQPHNTAATLRILPEYPVAPWHWADVTPDFELPAGVASVVDIDEVDSPAYNAVWLSGVKAGVSGPFGRTGTAKDEYAPQVVHSLITDSTVHRSRGIAELARSGFKETITIEMPVLPETGLILPGKFVRFAGTTGLVRGIGVSWKRPKVTQKLALETYTNA